MLSPWLNEPWPGESEGCEFASSRSILSTGGRYYRRRRVSNTRQYHPALAGGSIDSYRRHMSVPPALAGGSIDRASPVFDPAHLVGTALILYRSRVECLIHLLTV